MQNPVRRGWLVVVLCALTRVAAAQSPQVPARDSAATTQSAGAQVERKRLLAEDVFKNVEIFKGKDAARLIPAMDALRGLLGVDCTHCHTQFDWANESKPAKQKARQHFKLIEMVNREYFGGGNAASCWTCHRGQAVPMKYQRDEDAVAHATVAIQIPAASAELPAERVFKNIQSLKGVSAGRLPLVMAMFTKSLGVGCEHCHVEGMWDLDDKPEKTKARGMLRMVGVINGQFYGGNGPVHCVNCHQGNVKPELVSGTPSQGVFSPAAATAQPK